MKKYSAEHYYNILDKLLDAYIDETNVVRTIAKLLSFGLSVEQITDLGFSESEVKEMKSKQDYYMAKVTQKF